MILRRVELELLGRCRRDSSPVACQPSLHLLIPLWFDHPQYHFHIQRHGRHLNLHLSILLTHAQYYVALAGSTYHSGCHTWNLTTPHTAKLLSSFRTDILLYAGVPSRLHHVHGKQKKCMVSGLGPSTSSRQNISLGFAANHRVGACRAATLAIRRVTREPGTRLVPRL
jgi:hypothetical protein